MTDNHKIEIVLAGQGNSGKSTIFNFLTGLHQHIGNWAGKTFEKCEGTLFYKDFTVDVIDLPGIYSLTTFSEEELISREYIIHQKPDCVIDVVDSTNLERSLIFTLQLLEFECQVILALNMYDLAGKRRIAIDINKLRHLLDIPVIPTIASRGFGLSRLIDKVIELKGEKKEYRIQQYGKEIEDSISLLVGQLRGVELPYPARWVAIRLLEKDNSISQYIKKKKPGIWGEAERLCEKLEEIHGHDSSMVIADERSHLAARIARETVKLSSQRKTTLNDRLDAVTTGKISGYPVMIAILGGMFMAVFGFGNWLSGVLDTQFTSWHTWWDNHIGVTFTAALGWAGVESVLALIQIALPYILPFYVILYILEGWGYMARISFLMDQFMHKMGIHGKGCISFIIGFGCNVPGCLSCRIMESKRERFISAVLVTLVPCSAVSVIVFGLVGKYVGLMWALGLYLLAAAVILITGKILSRTLIGEPVELIMPMPDYKVPGIKTILYQTWDALKEFVYIAAPIVIISGIFIQAVNLAGGMPAISSFLSPVTVHWLGLPPVTGILLIFGILRKELILVMLAAYLGTTSFSEVLTPQQMITLAVVSMFYVPCVATISVLWKEYGWKKALIICIVEILFAIILAGLVNRILNLVF